MNPTGVRLACPDCQLDVVMTSEQDCPAPVTKVVEGVPICPNCNIAMKPIASVDTTPKLKAVVTPSMTLHEVIAKCAEVRSELKALEEQLVDASEEHKRIKKAVEAKQDTLNVIVDRIIRIEGGEQIAADLPLLDIAEQEPGRCDSVTEVDGAAVQCQGEAGHGGPHGNGDLTWAVLDKAAGSEAIAAATEDICQRLAVLHIVVDAPQIDTWTLEEYDAVLMWLAASEEDRPEERPACLPEPTVEATRTLATGKRAGAKRRRRGPIEEPEIEAETLANA